MGRQAALTALLAGTPWTALLVLYAQTAAHHWLVHPPALPVRQAHTVQVGQCAPLVQVDSAALEVHPPALTAQQGGIPPTMSSASSALLATSPGLDSAPALRALLASIRHLALLRALLAPPVRPALLVAVPAATVQLAVTPQTE